MPGSERVRLTERDAEIIEIQKGTDKNQASQSLVSILKQVVACDDSTQRAGEGGQGDQMKIRQTFSSLTLKRRSTSLLRCGRGER